MSSIRFAMQVLAICFHLFHPRLLLTHCCPCGNDQSAIKTKTSLCVRLHFRQENTEECQTKVFLKTTLRVNLETSSRLPCLFWTRRCQKAPHLQPGPQRQGICIHSSHAELSACLQTRMKDVFGPGSHN